MSSLQTKRGCRGFALMLAIFLIVTLAAVGVYLVTVSTGQGQAVAQDVQGVRAYQAARAGLDWGAFQLLRNSGACAPFTRLPLTPPGLSGFFAEVGCVQVGITETEGSVPVSVYRITVTGCNNNPCVPASPGPTYAERQLQLTVAQ